MLLFAFEQLQAHIGGSEVACDAYQVGVFCSGACHGAVAGHVAYAGDAYYEALARGGCVAAYDVDAVDFASRADAFVELVDVARR